MVYFPQFESVSGHTRVYGSTSRKNTSFVDLLIDFTFGTKSYKTVSGLRRAQNRK